MIEDLPGWINIVFLLTVGVTVLMFYYANGSRKEILTGLIIWSASQSFLALNGFYLITDTFPPRFILVLLPTTILIIISLLPTYRAKLSKDRNRTVSTFLHTVRIPVEIILFYLFINKMVPELMTFEGRNFDILAGLTAPIVGTLILTRRASNGLLISWNVISLVLVCFIMINGILSSELPFQQFGFEQPNKAMLYFPFILLPAVIVPIVIHTHLTELVILIKERNTAYNNANGLLGKQAHKDIHA
ncbi:hypothetical protein D770_25760 [Flammeovirgaceae bacterium 311]|nr:hypothetical protein D770_25760 [Flammeovirgaceae bacterium 311]